MRAWRSVAILLAGVFMIAVLATLLGIGTVSLPDWVPVVD